MAERSKSYLKQEFRDGERPTGADFGDFIDSYLNKVDDHVALDQDGNLNIPQGINLGDATAGQQGTLRFNSGQVQVFDGALWNNITGGGGGGAFTPVNNGPNVAYNGGNVGIGTGSTDPTRRLEVTLALGEQVKFGRAIIANGQGASQNYANFSHEGHATNSNFAIRQGPNGDVYLNAPSTQPIRITHGQTQSRVFIAPTGHVVIGNNAVLDNDQSILFQVNSNAGKTNGGSAWDVLSDVRLKQDIRPFEDGLSKLKKIEPVKFRYNGQLNTDPEQEEVGVIGQDIEKIFPYMIKQTNCPQLSDTLHEVIRFNNSALTYVMVNSIKELARKVEELEAELQVRKGEA